ncbi:MAG: hypothetical protein ACK56I_21075, partial [bacterium]
TVTQLILRNLTLGMGLWYMFAQISGAFLGNAFCYLITNKHATPVIELGKQFPWYIVLSEFIAVHNIIYGIGVRIGIEREILFQ